MSKGSQIKRINKKETTVSNVSTQTVIMKSEKNPVLGAVLGFFFAALGLFYSNTKAALIMLVPTIISGVLIPLFIGIPMMFACCVACAAWAYKSCESYNRELHAAHPTAQQSIKAAA